MKTKLEIQFEEAQQLVNELNNLDFTKPEEDVLFMENLDRLESMAKELDGEPQMVKPKTQKYLQ